MLRLLENLRRSTQQWSAATQLQRQFGHNRVRMVQIHRDFVLAHRWVRNPFLHGWNHRSCFLKKYTYGHILTNSSLDVANPKSLLSVTTLRGSVHLDIALGAQSSCASISVHRPVKKIGRKYRATFSIRQQQQIRKRQKHGKQRDR